LVCSSCGRMLGHEVSRSVRVLFDKFDHSCFSARAEIDGEKPTTMVSS
jgi:hypothetical protein